MDDRTRLPEPSAVAAQVAAARGGDASAYAWLQERFHRPLVGLVVLKTGWEHRHADQAVRGNWVERRPDILRPPASGGYDPEGSLLFHSYIWKHCIAWSTLYEAGDRHPPTVPLGTGAGEERDLPDEVQPLPDAAELEREHARTLSEAMHLLLEWLFRPETGYPHQQLAFGFAKLIYGEPSPRGLEGDPGRTVSAHGSTRLAGLTGEFGRAYADLFRFCPLDRERVERALDPLRNRLPWRVSELAAGDRESAAQWAGFSRRRVGKTALRDYFGAWHGDGIKAVTNWANRVKSRIERALGREGVTSQAHLIAQAEKALGSARSGGGPAQ